MGNLYVLTTPEPPLEFSKHSWLELLALLAWGIPALLIAEVLIRWMGPLLEASFFVRYAVMVGAVCAGGAMYGGLLPFLASLTLTPPNLYNFLPDVVELVISGLVLGLVGALMGGSIGMAEGVILSIPSAIILGLFKRGDRQHPS